MRLPSLSIFFPYLNDGAVVAGLLEASHRIAPEVAERFEVLVVDDGSHPEETRSLDRIAAAYPTVRVLRHGRNRGYGAAIRSGIARSSMEWIFYTDGDGQYDPLDLRLLWRRWQEDQASDIVNGYKLNRSDTRLRIVLGEAYRRLARGLCGLPIRDVNCDFRLLRGSLARGLTLRSQGGAIGLELVLAAQARGARFSEVGVRHHPRLSGASAFFTPHGLWQFARELVWLGGRFGPWVARR